MGHEHRQPEHKPEHSPGETVTYRPTGREVTIFGLEREKADRVSPVVYYWVFDGWKRFKALPEQLSKCAKINNQ